MTYPCTICGACCAYFRVSFYWGQTTAHPDGTVPESLTTPISPYHVAMRGTNQKSPRCVTLTGEIGQHSICEIYEQRSSSCREFAMGDERCQQARAHFGLPPVMPLDESLSADDA